ncbi:glycoside hydrolase family 88 protein [Butyrivibrio sp. WCE2006]|uniref:glycoside hydrolase family 88 protein n=1 Tax=Butyrivibrio sp. WCE2006 TaxID=1410611 RepID=UPI0005D29135|nr:glycoside hydrolase family 88 protein [Butyrivibrio sp. WCE2006]
MTQEIIEQMMRVAEADLLEINKYTPKDMVKDAAKKALGRATSNRDPIFWPAGLLMLGLSEAALSPSDSASKLISEPVRENAITILRSYLDRWIKQGEEVSYVDDSLTGVTLIKLFEKTDEKRYQHAAAKIAAFLSQCQKNPEESIIYNPSKGNDLIYADGAGQSAMFLSLYAAASHKRTALSIAAKQLVNFHQNGFDERSGLPYHAFSLSEGKKLGIIGWGRAVGWLMLGYSEILSNIQKQSKESENPISDSLLKQTSDKLMSDFYSLMKTILTYQRPDGGFSWLLPAIDGEADTSATAMIAYSMANWLRSGAFRTHAKELSTEIEKAVVSARDFLLEHTENGSVKQSLSGCEDIAVHRQTYGHYPWGQGSALAFLSILEF